MRDEIERLAAATLFPGFEEVDAPDWVRRRLDDGLGGVVLYARNAVDREQLSTLNEALRGVRDDVLVAIDEEGGDVTRLEAETGSSYPGNGALGHVDDVELTRDVALAMGADLASVGVNLDLAPVADVNTNPDNPIIGIRSFGADPDLVSRHVAAFVGGLQEAGVAACAKHFPGHGDTAEDSHLQLPTVETLEEAALEPFRAAIGAGTRANHDRAHPRGRARRGARDAQPPRADRAASRRARIHGHGDDGRARDARDQRRCRRRGWRRARARGRRGRALSRA